MSPLDDDDLFETPKAKPSNKIVYQPPGAQWSLDRLPEVESLYQSSFNKRLPLTNRGQGSIHNKWGYDHRNSADVSINPSSPEGQQFVEQLKKANVPFLAFNSAIPGVATGPHIHIGFPSHRTQQKFNVGSQKKSKSVASNDLFDTDDDLFDSGQTLPATGSKTTAVQPALSSASTTKSKAKSVPFEQALKSLTQQANQITSTVQRGSQGGVGELRRLDDPEAARIQRLQAEKARDPLSRNLLGRELSSAAARGVAQQAAEERVAEQRAQQQAPELERLTQVYRKQIREANNRGIGPEQWLNEAAAKGVAGLMDLGAGAVRAAKYNPLASGAEGAADKITLHAQALQRAAEAEGADRGFVSKIVQDALAGSVSTAPELAAMTLGAPPIATFAAGGGARAYGRGGNLREVAKEATHGAATGAAFELPIPESIKSTLGRAATKAGTTGGATAAIELASGADPRQALAGGITNAAFAGYGQLRHGGQRARQTEAQPDVPAQPETQRRGGSNDSLIGNVRPSSQLPNVEPVGEGQRAESREPLIRSAQESPRQWQHADFGLVTEALNQKKVGKGRVRVVAENGREHIIKRAALTGAGNQRAIPVKQEVPSESAVTPETLSPEASQLNKESAAVPAESARQFPTETLPTEGVRPPSSSPSMPEPRPLPELKDNFRKPLKEYADRFYRETSVSGALDMLPTSRRMTEVADVYLTNTPDLALGQGGNKGFMLEFEPGGLEGQVNRSKPAWEPLYKQGQAEFIARHNRQGQYQKALTAVTIKPDVKMSRAERMQIDRALSEMEQAGWAKATNEDGSTTYRKATAGAPAEYPPAVQEAFKAWNERRAYIDNAGNYRVKAEGGSSGPIAPWNKEVKRLFPSPTELHQAAQKSTEQVSDVPDQPGMFDARERIRASRPGEGGFAAVSSPTKKVGPTLAEAQRAVRLEPPPVSKRIIAGIKRLPERLQTGLVSEFTPLRKLEEAVRGKDVAVDMARKFEQVAGAPAKAEADFIDFKKAVVDPIRQHSDDFNAYLFLKRVEDRLTKDPERKKVATWTVEKAQQGLKELGESIGTDTMAKFEEVGKVYQDEMNRALQLQVESGRMSSELYDKIVNSSDFYAPFKVLKYIEQSEHGGGRNIATTQQLTKKITGIESEDFQVGNILQSSADQIMRSRVLAEKNLKMQELAKLADTENELIKKVPTDHHPRPGYEVVRYFEDGKPQGLEVTTDVAKAVQGLNASQASAVAKVALIARRGLQWGATGANAGFQVVNLFFADLPRQALVSRYGLRSPKDIYQFPLDWGYSLATSMKGNFGKPNELFMEWLRSGAANSTIQRELTPEVFRPKPISPGRTHPLKRVLESVADFSNAIEETSKILGLKRALRIEKVKDMTPEQRQATMEKIAAEVRNYSGSPDFLRKGSETRNLNLLFMFFNARLQGTASDIRRLAGKAGKPEAAAAWARLGTLVGIPATALAVVNNLPKYRDDYDKVPDWEKKNYFMIPRESFFRNDDGEMVRDYWRLPKRDVVGVFGNSIESFIDFAARRDPRTFKDFASTMLENLSPVNIEGENLMERGESVAGSLNPLIKVPIETVSNRDFFRKQPIVPDSMKKVSPELQYRKSTPRLYRAAGRGLGVSPLRLEHMAEGFTGSGFGQFSVREQPEGRPSAAGYPIIRRFVRSGQVKQERGVTETERGIADKQLQRRQVRDEMIDRVRRGESIDVDAAVRNGELTESDRKQIQRESKLTERQSRFADYIPAVALDRFERMDTGQQEEVRDQMETKAYTLLHSDALTQDQKDAFAARIDALGITPRNPQQKGAGGFRSRLTGFKSAFREAP